MKSSQQRAARQKIVAQMPSIQPYLDHFFPKKTKTTNAKCAGHIYILASQSGIPLFFQTRNGEFFPTLRILHKYPFLLPVLKVDRGAIKHVINGADVMLPGLKSNKATIPDDLDVGCVVAVFGEGKEHAISVGILKMNSEEMKTQDKGVAIESVHHVSDGLWKCTQLS